MVARAKSDPEITGILVHDFSHFFRDPYAGPMVKGELLTHGVRVVSVTEPEYDPRSIAGLAIEKMTEFKNASYSLDVAFHTRKGMTENVGRRDPEIGYCYKNGGAPLWGFKAYKVHRGTDRSGASIIKALWDKNDTVVAGRPVWEWARHVLLELRLKQHASLDEIRDFLNAHSVPAPRKRYWGTSSWHALLQPAALLQYAGYGVWNVHGKRGRHRSPSEWVVTENAHPAIITLEEADAINEVNESQSRLGTDRSQGRMSTVRSQGSRYMLTGGLLVCKRCGANMVGYCNRGHLYYVCGAKAYRRGLGCGPTLQIRKKEMEWAVTEEVGRLFNSWADTKRLMDMVKEEIRSRYRQDSAERLVIKQRLVTVAEELNNVRRAVKAGLDDLDWANEELCRLKQEQMDLQIRVQALVTVPPVPQMNGAQIEEYRHRFSEIVAQGTNEEKRTLARCFLKKIEVDPATGEVVMYLFGRPPALPKPQKSIGAPPSNRAPIGLVAGAGFEPATFG